MKAGLAALLLLGAATALGAADDPKAPLADTSQQIQQLKKQENDAKTGAPSASLQAVLPGLQASVQGREALPVGDVPLAKPADKEKVRRQAKKNWLVDTYDQLDPKADHRKALDLWSRESPVAGGEKAETSDVDDSDLLTLFRNDAKEPTRSDENPHKPLASPTADPLAPFLREWLGQSPVRDAVLSTLAPGESAGIAAAGPSGGGANVAAPMNSLSVGNPHAGSPAKEENPFLAALALPTLESAAGAPPPAPMPEPLPQLDKLGTPGPLAPSGPAAAPAKEDWRKPPPSATDDDRKYFPQLKRF